MRAELSGPESRSPGLVRSGRARWVLQAKEQMTEPFEPFLCTGQHYSSVECLLCARACEGLRD